ncbi:MAG: hypothetical protein JWP66_969 [Naasia sp.]|nr:hypothetical protein [Naasia sp.]
MGSAQRRGTSPVRAAAPRRSSSRDSESLLQHGRVRATLGRTGHSGSHNEGVSPTGTSGTLAGGSAPRRLRFVHLVNLSWPMRSDAWLLVLSCVSSSDF